MDYPPIFVLFHEHFGCFGYFGTTKETETHQKIKFAIGMLTCHVDSQGYLEKHFFGCVAWKLKQKVKFRPATLRT